MTTYSPDNDRDIFESLDGLSLACDLSDWIDDDLSYVVTSENVDALIRLADEHDYTNLADLLRIDFDRKVSR